MENGWDAIVIGSGIGGLSTAGLLAACAGKKVLVLEKHSEPGGLTHVFRRDGASWDVGLHYVGEMETGTLPRSLMDFLSGGRLEWNPMPEEFEKFVYPGLTFAVPSDPAEYERRLVSHFPSEARAIHRYFRDIRRGKAWNVLSFFRRFMPSFVGGILGLIAGLTGGKMFRTTGDYLDRNFGDSQLKALLASQWGDYGLPPSESAFAIHALIVGHYLNGAWFPKGGSSRIARTFERGIEARGGKVLVCQEVVEIITDGNRAVGVRVLDRRGKVPREVRYDAPLIISGVGAAITYGNLLPRHGTVARKTTGIRTAIDSMDAGGSAVTLYLRLNKPVSTIGVQGENYWINANTDHDSLKEQTRKTLEGEPTHIYVSFPSAKSGEGAFHTAEIISFVEDTAFSSWKGTQKGNRGADYSALKEKISDGLLRLAETAVPGLSALVTYRELSTPLTVEDYTSHPRGHFYGLPAVPDRYRALRWGPRSPIRGLLLTGQDAGTLGITGALMAGVGAASRALGPLGFFRIMAAVKGPQRAIPEGESAPEKKRAVVISNAALTPSIRQIKLRVDEPFDWLPGQYARLRVADEEWRDYSIASSEGKEITLLVSTRTGGKGSAFAALVQPGTVTQIELPLGEFHLQENGRRKIFVATGTGIAPLLPMFRDLRETEGTGRARLYFGSRVNAENIAGSLVRNVPLEVINCVSRETPESGGFAGRVTDALKTLDFDPETVEFYLCGSAAMVTDSRTILESAGARYILTEAY
jgi:all-trans-retinol 13,14-reductase